MGKIKTILGDNIRTLRTEKGWTPFLAQIESGKRGTSLELVESVAELFGIPIASLFLEQITNYAESKSYVRDVELKIAEKQLQEIISENITKTFERLREK